MTDSQKALATIIGVTTANSAVNATAWAHAAQENGKKFAEDAIKAGSAVLNQAGEVIDYVQDTIVSGGEPNKQNSNASGSFTENTIVFKKNGSSVFDENERLRPLPIKKKTDGVESDTTRTFAVDVSPEYAIASIGSFLGRTIDSGVTNLKELVDKIGDFAADEWKKISTKSGNIHSIIDIDKDGKVKQYFDNDTISYFSRYLNEKGFFRTSDTIDTSGLTLNYKYKTKDAKFYSPVSSIINRSTGKIMNNVVASSGKYPSEEGHDKVVDGAFDIQGEVKAIGFQQYDTTMCKVVLASESPFTYRNFWGTTVQNQISANKYSKNGKELYIGFPADLNDYPYTSTRQEFHPPLTPWVVAGQRLYNDKLAEDVITIFYSPTGSTIPGVGTQSGGVTPDTTTWTNDKTTKESLRSTYPKSYNNTLTQTVIQPTGNTITKEYVPVSVPTEGVGEKIGTLGNTQDGAITGIEAGAATDTQANAIVQALKQAIGLTKGLPVSIAEALSPLLNPPATGTGTTPPLVAVTGSASALYTVHAPSLSQLNAFGSWLWSSSFIDQVAKLFSNPMEAVIGLHRIYSPVPTSGSSEIKAGYISSGVVAPEVSNQFTTVDCGTVYLQEYFGNVFDYQGTTVQIYLPFIGIVSLSVDDCMRGEIHVVYHVDIFTGACLATVSISRDGTGGTLYQYSGNAAATLPVSSGSYTGIITSLTNVVSRAAIGFGAGGIAGAIVGAGTAALSADGTHVQRSGGFSGNAGAMGIKKPYLIIERPQTEVTNFSGFSGFGTNKYVTISECSGYTRVKEVYTDFIDGATDSEKDEIKRLLKDGIVIK